MSWNSTFDVRHPTKEVAPFLQTGTKIPENLKIYRGQATFTNTGAHQYKFLLDVQDPTKTITFKPGSVIIEATMKSTATLTGTDPLNLYLSVTVPTANPPLNVPAATTAVTTLVTLANATAGCVLPLGQIGGNIAVSPMACATNGYFPIITSTFAAGSPVGTVYVTMLVLECFNN